MKAVRDEGEEHGDADEVHQHRPYRQGEDEERGVLAELRVGVAEVHLVEEEEYLLPAAGVADADDDGHDDGDEQHDASGPAPLGGPFEDVVPSSASATGSSRGEILRASQRLP